MENVELSSESRDEAEAEEIIDLKDRLIDLISPSDLIPENNFESMTIEAFERACTEIEHFIRFIIIIHREC